MSEWREKAVEEHMGRITLLPGEAEPRGDADVSYLSDEDYRRAYNGYECPWCFQPLAHAFERTCKEWCCGGDREYTIEEWHGYMDGSFDGYKWLGPSKAALESMGEERSSEIWTPGGA